MVKHFSDTTYVHLMRSTIQEETLAGKVAFETCSATFGFKIYRYHEDNGIFYEQPFRSTIEDSNQTILFCGVGSHNQNFIVERIIQTLTLGAIKFPLHEKRYWPEAITTILCPYALKSFT